MGAVMSTSGGHGGYTSCCPRERRGEVYEDDLIAAVEILGSFLAKVYSTVTVQLATTVQQWLGAFLLLGRPTVVHCLFTVEIWLILPLSVSPAFHLAGFFPVNRWLFDRTFGRTRRFGSP
jgi:hypothetical protein